MINSISVGLYNLVLYLMSKQFLSFNFDVINKLEIWGSVALMISYINNDVSADSAAYCYRCNKLLLNRMYLNSYLSNYAI